MAVQDDKFRSCLLESSEQDDTSNSTPSHAPELLWEVENTIEIFIGQVDSWDSLITPLEYTVDDDIDGMLELEWNVWNVKEESANEVINTLFPSLSSASRLHKSQRKEGRSPKKSTQLSPPVIQEKSSILSRKSTSDLPIPRSHSIQRPPYEMKKAKSLPTILGSTSFALLEGASNTLRQLIPGLNKTPIYEEPEKYGSASVKSSSASRRSSKTYKTYHCYCKNKTIAGDSGSTPSSSTSSSTDSAASSSSDQSIWSLVTLISSSNESSSLDPQTGDELKRRSLVPFVNDFKPKSRLQERKDDSRTALKPRVRKYSKEIQLEKAENHKARLKDQQKLRREVEYLRGGKLSAWRARLSPVYSQMSREIKRIEKKGVPWWLYDLQVHFDKIVQVYGGTTELHSGTIGTPTENIIGMTEDVFLDKIHSL
ncbi:uncharacterized protein IL334_004099 [Kwoniella shivajii]|uniref:BZIP domain-containing protein n=1 Tax=Kwoniella shivajii TaxID=564305 RepID=A0ABZ1CZE2_9TREE|nr:hypothetical protein IL334_004099 [Kwoniella shivajii]